MDRPQSLSGVFYESSRQGAAVCHYRSSSGSPCILEFPRAIGRPPRYSDQETKLDSIDYEWQTYYEAACAEKNEYRLAELILLVQAAIGMRISQRDPVLSDEQESIDRSVGGLTVLRHRSTRD